MTGLDFLAQIGNGVKTHAVSMELTLAEDDSKTSSRYEYAVDSDGRRWILSWTALVLNRQARIFAVAANGREATSQHVGWDTTRR